MNELIVILLVIGVGLSAYTQARRQGVWSWWLFARTILAVAVVIALNAGLMVWLSSVLGPEHAWLVVVLELFVIAAGVSVLALWLRPRPPRRPG